MSTVESERMTVFGVSDKVELKLTYSATEARKSLGIFEYKLEIH